MGSLHAIEAVSVKLNDDITVECARYRQMNELRNPYRDFEKYFLPACVALASWILSVVVHVSCTSATCISIKATLGRVYMSIFVIGLCIFWAQIKGAIASLKAVVTAMQTTHKMTSTGAGGARMRSE